MSCDCSPSYLIPDGSSQRRYYIVWKCSRCGKRYTCECFRGVIEHVSTPGWQESIPGYLSEKRIGLGNASEMEKKVILRAGGTLQETACDDLKTVQYRTGICHFCRGRPSTDVYTKYADPIIKHYLPYIMVEAIRSGVDTREAENRVRKRLGVPNIGEGWVSETQLYHLVCVLFPNLRVEREASPEWLRRMRFDIFLPEVNVAVEYQGEQHYRAIECFGGDEGFAKTWERDRLKRRLAKRAGVEVVEFKYDERITEKAVWNRISRAIKRDTNA